MRVGGVGGDGVVKKLKGHLLALRYLAFLLLFFSVGVGGRGGVYGPFTYIEPIVHQRWAKTGEP